MDAAQVRADAAMELIRQRAWRGAPADLDEAFDVLFGEVRQLRAEVERLGQIEQRGGS